MKTFEANRLSDGNKVFPSKISIDNFGVTLKIPGLLGGKEKTLSYQQISSIAIDTPMVGYSKITFDTLGLDRIIATGFSKGDAQEIKQLVQKGISISRGGGGFQQSGGYEMASQVVVQEVKSAEQIRAEHEVAMEKRRIAKEEEEKEKGERQIKAQKFKDKEQPFIAWLVELNPIYSICLVAYPFLFLLGPEGFQLTGILSIVILISLLIKDIFKISWKMFGIIIAVFLISVIGYGVYNSGSDDREMQESVERNSELEKIENEILLGISTRVDKKKLLDLVSQLQCEEGSAYVDGKKNGIINTGRNSSSGPDDIFFGTYTEYWSAKREAYTEIIMSGVKIEDYIEKIRQEKNKLPSTNQPIKENTENDTIIKSGEAEEEIFVQNEAEPGTLGSCIKEKAYFYAEPDESTKRKAFIVNGQNVDIDVNQYNDYFVYAVYRSLNGKETVGWMLKSDLEINE